MFGKEARVVTSQKWAMLVFWPPGLATVWTWLLLTPLPDTMGTLFQGC